MGQGYLASCLPRSPRFPPIHLTNSTVRKALFNTTGNLHRKFRTNCSDIEGRMPTEFRLLVRAHPDRGSLIPLTPPRASVPKHCSFAVISAFLTQSVTSGSRERSGGGREPVLVLVEYCCLSGAAVRLRAHSPVRVRKHPRSAIGVAVERLALCNRW